MRRRNGVKMSKVKIFVWCNGGSVGMDNVIAMGEDGEVVGNHCCSNRFFHEQDMGFYETDWSRKRERYDKVYGKGNWELEYVEYDEVKGHEGLQKAFKLNDEIRKKEGG